MTKSIDETRKQLAAAKAGFLDFNVDFDDDGWPILPAPTHLDTGSQEVDVDEEEAMMLLYSYEDYRYDGEQPDPRW